jgi:hypothetical protein
MKRILPYALALILGGAIITLFLSAKKKRNKVLDERFSLRKNDKIPYGSWVAYNSLPDLFPKASITINKYEPGYWDSLSNYEDKQVLIILTGRFDADREELQRMMRFVENGNHVLISAQYLSSAADKLFNCGSSAYNMSIVSIKELETGMKIRLNGPLFDSTRYYGYPGRSFESYFSRVDTLTTDALGQDFHGRTNLIRLQAGKGYVYVHLEPFAFTNFFLLHNKNIEYYEHLMSLMPRDAEQVVWDEYYLNRRSDRPAEEKKNWFSVLMNMKNEEGQHSFRAAFLLLIALLLLYVYMEMRRKQRIIPPFTRPKNDSLDFVKTIGRLYHDKGDHKNLSRKMSSYFLEHVRNKYKLSTGTLDAEFTRNLAYKSGVGEEEIQPIVSFIKKSEQAFAISPQQLMNFHNRLQSFYQKA